MDARAGTSERLKRSPSSRLRRHSRLVVAAALAAAAAGVPQAAGAAVTDTGPGQRVRYHRPETLRHTVLPLPGGATDPHLVRLAENGDVLAHVVLGGAVHAVVWRSGRPTDLGEADPIDLEAGRAVADRGDVIRYWSDLDAPATTLPLPAGAVRARAVDLAHSGTVAGIAEDADGGRSAVVWPRGGRPVTIVGVPAGGAVRVIRVTDDDAVFGDVQEPGGDCRVWRWDADGGLGYVLRRPDRPQRGFLAGPLAAVSAKGRWLVTGAGGDTVATVWSQGAGLRAVISAGSIGVESAVATAVNDQGLVGGAMSEWTTLYERGWRWDHRFGLVGEPWSGPVADMNALGDVVSARVWPRSLRVTHGPTVRVLDHGDDVPSDPQINDVGQLAADVTVVDDDYRPLRKELVMWS